MGKDFIMKTHRSKTSSRRKNRRAHFQASSHLRYRLMSAALSAPLKETHKVNAMPVRKDDEVEIVRPVQRRKRQSDSRLPKAMVFIHRESPARQSQRDHDQDPDPPFQRANYQTEHDRRPEEPAGPETSRTWGQTQRKDHCRRSQSIIG